MVVMNNADTPEYGTAFGPMAFGAIGFDAQVATFQAVQYRFLSECLGINPSLNEAGALGFDDFQLVEGFNALDGGFYAQGIGKTYNCGDDFCAILVLLCTTIDKRTVDLNLVKRS